MVGIPKFKPEPEPEPEPERARATAVNFAAEHERPKTVKIAKTPSRQKTTTSSKPQPLAHFVEFPRGNLTVH